MAEIAKDSCSSIYYYRNRMMIDLTKTPNEIKEKILESYNEQENKPKNKIMNYFIINRMKNFIETTGDFN